MNETKDTYQEDVATFRKLTTEMNGLFARKRRDYGASTRETFAKFGPVSMLTRLNDKMARLENLLLRQECNSVTDESVEDTLLDLANYALITIIEREYQRKELRSITRIDHTTGMEL